MKKIIAYKDYFQKFMASLSMSERKYCEHYYCLKQRKKSPIII